MILSNLIKLEKPLYIHYTNPDHIYCIKQMLRFAKQQGVLSEICSRLGISLRSVQRWLPTPRVIIKTKKPTAKLSYSSLWFGDEAPSQEYEITKRKRVNKKKKALPFNKSIEQLLARVLLCNEDIPDIEPTNEEILKLLLELKESLGTWKKVSELLNTEEMVLYRFRKTGKMKKCHRIYLYLDLPRLIEWAKVERQLK